MPSLLEWEFPGGGWLQLFEKPDKAGSGAVTIVEDDLKARIASLQTAHVRIDREMMLTSTHHRVFSSLPFSSRYTGRCRTFALTLLKKATHKGPPRAPWAFSCAKTKQLSSARER